MDDQNDKESGISAVQCLSLNPSTPGQPLDSTLCSPPSEQPSTPPHRSHDPSNNLKRSDPFQFGSRYLLPTDDVFEFNAWDHVETDETYNLHAETQYTNQRQNPVSTYDKHRFNADPEKWWNRFYTNNTSNFFKDRKWLHQEFPILRGVTAQDAGPKVVLEIGAGAGNTAFPIMKANENEDLLLHACDFSRKAVELIRSSPLYNAPSSKGRIEATVWDVSSAELPEGLNENGVDVVLLIFIFSALSPQQWEAAVRNVYRLLKPGGEVCFRDYGRGDLAQVRFKKGRWMEENFYVRGDGTRVYFFGQDELRDIWIQKKSAGTATTDIEIQEPHEASKLASNDSTNSDTIGEDEVSVREDGEEHIQVPAFEIVSLGVDRRLLINRQRQLKMYRCWMQGRFRKPSLPLSSHSPWSCDEMHPLAKSRKNDSP
ncbi:tRNA(thr) (cytosine(32)-N(3))-methyltransferase [Physcia stellaris]|nr:tRNA(thr) (cytosine(32)-N(3))-methyltransferase [Physcia stellaris]